MQRAFKRSFDSLEDLFDFTEGFFDEEKIPREHLFAVDLAVEELFTNMVKYNPAGAASIEVQLQRSGDQLRVTVTDLDADPFDPTAVGAAPVDSPLNERQPGRLGLLLVKKVMDEVEYEHGDRRSKVTLVKRLR